MNPINFDIETHKQETTINCFYYEDFAGQIYITIIPLSQFLNTGEFDSSEIHKLRYYFNSNRLIAIIDWIEIFDDFKGVGIGSKLLDFSIDYIKNHRISNVFLHACAGESGLSQRELVRFYNMRGFEKIIEYSDGCLMGINNAINEAVNKVISGLKNMF